MNEWVQIAGWVLLHFLWQGSLLAIVAAARCDSVAVGPRVSDTSWRVSHSAQCWRRRS